MGMAMMGTGMASGANRAEEAARKAICSPLLEDVDLQGARGLLINISGNTDISLEEYSRVNEIIAEMAHPDANIIIGTAIDPEIGDALAVTVVATGLGQAETLKVVRGGRGSQAPAGALNYGDLEQPAISRRNPREPAPMRSAPAVNTAEDLSFIDIPTFLRRQAD
jgi:cell division protein FtsZ